MRLARLAAIMVAVGGVCLLAHGTSQARAAGVDERPAATSFSVRGELNGVAATSAAMPGRSVTA
jgi:hypothetical protein